jgi:hypothetical protein
MSKKSGLPIRRRGASVLRRLASLPDSQWRSAVIDIPKRRHQHIEYVDELVRLDNYEGEARQVAVRGLGGEAPTFFLSNHLEISPRNLVMDYARRNGVEDALGSSVDFFHLDCLSSEVRLNVDLDAILTVLAHGCYRWLATQLHGFGLAKPKSVYRKFVETSGTVEIETGRRIVVYFDRRSHNPILREAQLDKDSPPIPWLSKGEDRGWRIENGGWRLASAGRGVSRWRELLASGDVIAKRVAAIRGDRRVRSRAARKTEYFGVLWKNVRKMGGFGSPAEV